MTKFQDWVMGYLKEKGSDLPASWLDRIKELGFDLSQENDNSDTWLIVSELLIEDLRCNFSRKKWDYNSARFTFAFCSVMANLEKSVFDKLCKMRNAIFVYFSPKPACVKDFPPYEDIANRLKVVAFYYETAQLDWSVMRWIIAHEIAHLFVGHDDEKADKRALEWGFCEEKETFDKWCALCKEKGTPKLLWEFN